MKLSKLTLGLAAAGLLGMGTSAQALNIFPSTLLEDDDFEYQAVDTNQNGLLDVGDTLRGIFDITKIVNQSNGDNYDPAELTGVFETEVKTKVANGLLFDFTFGPVGGATGTIFSFFTDAADDFAGVNCGTIAACEATATGGSLWATFGFTGDADEQWDALGAPDDPTFFTTIDSATALGNFRFALSNIINNTGYDLNQVDLTGCGVIYACAGDGKVDMIGSGSILGTSDLTTPYLASSDTDFKISAVPEPGTLAMLTLGLFGLGSRMRKMRA